MVELPVPEEDLAVEAQAFAVSEAGKCSVTIGDAVGGVALDKQVVQYIADSAATCNMTPDADGLTNYRECSRPLGLANGEEISIVGYGDLTVNFRTDHRWVRVKMNDVAHVPQLSHNLISLPSMTLKGHTYMGDKGGVTLKLKGGETVFFPLVGKLCRQYGFRPEAAGSMVDSACTTIAPGKTKTPTTPTDINILHCTSGHTHEVLLKKEQQGVNPSGELHECRGCSMARGLRKSIARSTHTGADTLRLSRTPAAAAPYCQRGGVYSGGGRERGGGVKSRRKEGARRGQRVQPRQRSGGVAPGVTRNARGASGRIRSRGSGGAEGNPPTPSASPGRGGASGRIRSRGSGGAEDDTPTPYKIVKEDSALHCGRQRSPQTLETRIDATFLSTLFALDVDHSVRCVLSTVLHNVCTCNSMRRRLSTVFGSVLSAADVDHPVRCVLCTVLHSFCTRHSIQRPLSAAFGSALFAADVDHPVRGVLWTVLHSFRRTSRP